MDKNKRRRLSSEEDIMSALGIASQELFDPKDLDGEDVQSVRSEMSDGDLDLDFSQLDKQMDNYENALSHNISAETESDNFTSNTENTSDKESNEGSLIQQLVEINQESSLENNSDDKIQLPSKNPGGRNKASIWSSFDTKKDKNGKVISNKCKKCWKPVSAKACRMMDHKKKCKGHLKTQKFFDVTVQSNDLPCSSKAKNLQFPSKEEMAKGMKNWTKKHDTDSLDEMDSDMAKFIFSANLSFDTVKNPFLKKIVQKAMGSNYQPPTPKRLKTTLLDKCYNEARHLQMLDLKGKKVVIVQDGWSTNQNESVISHCLHTGSKSVFLNAVSTGNTRKDSGYCSQLLEEAIDLAEKTFGCLVVGVCTDNCNVMKAMRGQVGKKRNLLTYGCNAHVFNLLGQDITDEELIAQVVSVQKYFRRHHFESGTLKQLKGKRPTLPGTTRWNSQVDCLDNYKQNHSKYLEISRMVESGIGKEKELMSVIEDPTLYSRVTELHQLMKPIAAYLDRAQSENCSLAEAFHMWKELWNKLKLAEHKDVYNKRKQIWFSKFAVAAYMMHPKYKGAGLTRDELDVGFEYLNEVSPKLVALAASLQAQDSEVFPKHLLFQTTLDEMSAQSWWKAMSKLTKIDPACVDICETLMMLPASSACIERSFSTLSDIVTKKRNRLSVDTAQKLCVVNRKLAPKGDDVYVSDEEDDANIITID